jgi:hypothetical protein
LGISLGIEMPLLTLLAVSPFAAILSAPTAGAHVISKAGGCGEWSPKHTDGVNFVMLKQ